MSPAATGVEVAGGARACPHIWAGGTWGQFVLRNSEWWVDFLGVQFSSIMVQSFEGIILRICLVGKVPWRRVWQRTPVFLLENPMDRRAWQAMGLQRVRHD